MPYYPNANINIPFDKWKREDFIEKIDELQDLNYLQFKEIKQLMVQLEQAPKNLHKLKNEDLLKKNPRGAGRKTKITPELVSKVKQLRASKKTYDDIAKEMNLSVGLIYKVAGLA
jgi:hypothetical protein